MGLQYLDASRARAHTSPIIPLRPMTAIKYKYTAFLALRKSSDVGDAHTGAWNIQLTSPVLLKVQFFKYIAL